MKIPPTPPEWHDQLVSLFKKDDIFPNEILEKLPYKEEYLHWDQLRYKPRLAGEFPNHKQWWALLKLNRLNLKKKIPLSDKKGRAFTYGLTEKMFQALRQIDLRAGGEVEMVSSLSNIDLRDRYYVSSMMEESITSSLLEGAATTRKEAKEFLRSGRKPKTMAEKMVVNNYDTMKKLAEIKDEPFSEALILEIHKRITKNTLDTPDEEGRFRNESENITVGDSMTDEIYHIPPDANELPERMKALCEFANETEMKGFLHPVIRAIIIHFWLAYDHPFVDGNGRTARALFYWAMLKQGFWLFEYISISRELNHSQKAYAQSFLYTETDENDLNYFILHQLEVINKQINHLHDYIQYKQKEMANASKALNRLNDFNVRQVAVIQRAITYPETIFTFKSHQNSHQIVYQTSRTDLLELAEKGYLIKNKQKNAIIFEVAPDIMTRKDIQSLFK